MADIQAMRQKFFQGRRDDIERQGRGQVQEAQDALTRRFTTLGQAGSGAAIAASQKAREGIQANVNSAQNELAGHELQGFEQDATRDFARQQAKDDMSFKKGLFDVEQGNKLKEIDLAERQFALDKDTTAFNRRLAEAEMGRKNPGLFGGDGFLGTGIDLGNPLANPGDFIATVGAPLTTLPAKALGIGGGK